MFVGIRRENANINRPKDSDFDLPRSRERQRVVIRPLAGARGYREVQSSKHVGFSHAIALGNFRRLSARAHGPGGQRSSAGRVLWGSACVAAPCIYRELTA